MTYPVNWLGLCSNLFVGKYSQNSIATYTKKSFFRKNVSRETLWSKGQYTGFLARFMRAIDKCTNGNNKCDSLSFLCRSGFSKIFKRTLEGADCRPKGRAHLNQPDKKLVKTYKDCEVKSRTQDD